MAPFTWEGGDHGSRQVRVHGLKVDLTGKLYDERTKSWRPTGLFELKLEGCKLDLTIVRAETKGLKLGIRRTQGTIMIDGTSLR